MSDDTTKTPDDAASVGEAPPIADAQPPAPSEPPTEARVLSGLALALASAAAGIGVLRLFPFLAFVDLLGSGFVSPESWSTAVLLAAALGAVAGALGASPLPWAARVGIVVASDAAVLLEAAVEATASSMTSGDSLLALILLSPVGLVAGCVYLVLIAGASLTLVGIARALAQPLPRAPLPSLLLAVALAGGGAALLARFVASHDPKAEPPPAAVAPAAAPEPPPLADCNALESAFRSFIPAWRPAVRVVPRDEGSHPALRDVVGEALRCRTATGPLPVTLLEPRPFSLRLRARPPRGTPRAAWEEEVTRTVTERWLDRLFLNADGDIAVTLPDDVRGQLLAIVRCAPPGDDLVCTGHQVIARDDRYYPAPPTVTLELR